MKFALIAVAWMIAWAINYRRFDAAVRLHENSIKSIS